MRQRVAGGPYNPVISPLANPFMLTSAPNGGNNPWTIPSLVYDQATNKTVLSWNDGNNGSIETADWDHAAETIGTVYAIHSNFHKDAHDSPALVRRASDGRWIVVYSTHNSTPMNIRVATNANDRSAWGAATNLDSQLGGSRYTDYQLFERSGTLWMVYRDEPSAGTDSRWCISSCSSATPTSGWAAQTQVYRLPSTRSYVITLYDPIQDRLHFIATNGASTGFTKLGHFYRDMAAGTYHKTDGTTISLTILSFATITEIYSGTASVFAGNLAFDGSGNPVVSASDGLDFIYLRYDGASWSSTVITDAGVGYSYNNDGNFGPWGNCVDDGDPDLVWLLKDTDGTNPQLYLYDDSDSSLTQITTDLTGDQTQVICVRSPDSSLRAVWQSSGSPTGGTGWTTYTNWNQGLMGVGI